MIKDTGRRDSAGLEDMDAFFSPTTEKSPRRTGPATAAPILSRKTRQSALSDEPLSMSGTSSTPLHTLARPPMLTIRLNP